MPVWVGHSCPTKPAQFTQSDFSARFKTKAEQKIKSKSKTKVKSVGQECPTHTGLASSGALLDP